MALISGWGEMDPKKPEQEDPGRSPRILRAAAIPFIEWNACKNANFLYQEMVTKTMTCAGYMTGKIIMSWLLYLCDARTNDNSYQ